MKIDREKGVVLNRLGQPIEGLSPIDRLKLHGIGATNFVSGDEKRNPLLKFLLERTEFSETDLDNFMSGSGVKNVLKPGFWISFVKIASPEEQLGLNVGHERKRWGLNINQSIEMAGSGDYQDLLTQAQEGKLQENQLLGLLAISEAKLKFIIEAGVVPETYSTALIRAKFLLRKIHFMEKAILGMEITSASLWGVAGEFGLKIDRTVAIPVLISILAVFLYGCTTLPANAEGQSGDTGPMTNETTPDFQATSDAAQTLDANLQATTQAEGTLEAGVEETVVAAAAEYAKLTIKKDGSTQFSQETGLSGGLFEVNYPSGGSWELVVNPGVGIPNYFYLDTTSGEWVQLAHEREMGPQLGQEWAGQEWFETVLAEFLEQTGLNQDQVGFQLDTWTLPNNAEEDKRALITITLVDLTNIDRTGQVFIVVDAQGLPFMIDILQEEIKETLLGKQTAALGESLPPQSRGRELIISEENQALLEGKNVGLGMEGEQVVYRDITTGEIVLIESEVGSGVLEGYERWLKANPEVAVAEIERQLELATTDLERANLWLERHSILQTPESARELAEFLNEHIVADEVYVSMHFDELGGVVPGGDIKVGWDAVEQRWRADYNAGEFIDLTGSTLPELIVPGYTNINGQEVYINPETGEEYVVPKIDLPGLGEVTLADLYFMDQEELNEYTWNLMMNAEGTTSQGNFEYLQNSRDSHFALPVILEQGYARNMGNAIELDRSTIYSRLMQNVVGSMVEIPEARTGFMPDNPTNSVLMPVFDDSARQLICWIRIHQGVVDMGTTNAVIFDSGREEAEFARLHYTNWELFGHNLGNNQVIHVPAILFSGNTTEIAYEIYGSEPFLENGKGIGDAEEVKELLATQDTNEIISLLTKLRLIVLRPDKIIYQRQQR